MRQENLNVIDVDDNMPISQEPCEWADDLVTGQIITYKNRLYKLRAINADEVRLQEVMTEQRKKQRAAHKASLKHRTSWWQRLIRFLIARR